LRGHGGSVFAVAWSPDGKWIATRSYDDTTRVWDAASGAEQRTLRGHGDEVTAVAWSPDGKWIAMGSGVKMDKVWLGTPEQLIELAFSRIGRNAKVLLSDERKQFGYQ
jgi:WD40 repeat protein